MKKEHLIITFLIIVCIILGVAYINVRIKPSVDNQEMESVGGMNNEIDSSDDDKTIFTPD